MTEEVGGARPGASRPGTETNVPRSCRDYIDGPLCTPDNRCPAHQAGIDPESLKSLLARVGPRYIPANDGELTAWAEGYSAGWNQGYSDGWSSAP